MSAPARNVRVLLVDDSDMSRAAVEVILRDAPGMEVVGTARDGDEALRTVDRVRPDLVLLDLQMPRMDGFTFLRLLMARCPTPVLVVSSNPREQDVFKALDLGALDFLAKPAVGGAPEDFREELLDKVETLRQLRLEHLGPPRPAGPLAAVRPEQLRVAVLGASTGGPHTLRQLLATLPRDLPLALVVAQHMPERFTATFAERLARTTSFTAKEAESGDLVVPGRVLVAPGGRHLELVRGPDGVRAEVRPADPGRSGSRYAPSVDRLLASAAAALGPRACGVVLTGMGQDGAEGILAVKRAGGLTLAESSASAVVYGMPQSAVATGAVDEELDLAGLAARLARFARTP
ncbi:MAG: chemotaxis-specific protein-glutamate methyltransferase CheB [Anaeromyxobacter sp.]